MVFITKTAAIHSFICYRCGTEFNASHPDSYKTETGYGCKCPTCGYAAYTHK